MSNRKNNILYSLLSLVVYIGVMVGFGFVLNLFWKVDVGNLTMFWISTALVCACVAFFVILMLFTQKDKGLGAMQLFFTLFLSFMPITIRAINMVPYAGFAISGVIVFITLALYLITMIAMGYYATDLDNNSDNRSGGKRI